MRVLDVAAGAGDQTTRAAARVGRDGSVVATDISADVMQFAAGEAHGNGILNVAFRSMSCEQLNESDETFDAVVCRNGLQYVADLSKGLSEIQRVLRPAGRFGAIVWSAQTHNAFLAKPFAIVRRKLNLPSPGHNDPGPFRLGEDGAFQTTLESAGFRDVRIVSVDAPAAFESTSEALLFLQEAVGDLSRLLADATAAERAEAWREIEAALQAFETPQGFTGPGALLVGSCAR
jgi:ubiquinone/menaquinone biosynthesis C-methylase UbiE